MSAYKEDQDIIYDKFKKILAQIIFLQMAQFVKQCKN